MSAAALLLFAQVLLGSAAPRALLPAPLSDTARTHRIAPNGPETADSAARPLTRRERRMQARAAREEARRAAAFNALPQEERDSLLAAHIDSLVASQADSLSAADGTPPAADSLQRDTVRKPRAAKGFLDDPLDGKSTDSLVYDVRNKLVYIYNEGDVTYQSRNLKADYMQIDMNTKLVYAYGKPDSVDGVWTVTKPEFTEGSAAYQMDTITYNLDSQKAKIKGVATQQGDGWLVGGSVKKMPDNTFNIEHGKYTTCEETDHPHFYLAMTKAKVIPGKKVVTGPAYLVMEDVPIYFLGIPEGFFPINMGPKSGLLMPTYGEEYSKGFFLRDLGYYFTLGEYADLAVRGGFYTLGSWEASAASRYIKRYKYSGSFNLQYSNIKTGEKGEPDYIKQSNFRIQWTHSQDAKANPGSTFSASVNFATSGYNRYSATNIDDILSTQTNSSISYSKNWAGTPFSLSANMAISQNSQNKSISVTLPTVVFNVSRLYPFKRKERTGKERWYEENLDAVHGQDDQLGDHHRIGNLLPEDARQHEERHRALDPRLGVVQPVQLHQHLAVVQLHREVVFQETGIPVEPHDEPDRHARLGLRILPPLQLQRRASRPRRPSTACTTSRRSAATARSRPSATRSPRRSASPSPRTSAIPATDTTSRGRPTPRAASRPIRPMRSMPTAFPRRESPCR